MAWLLHATRLDRPRLPVLLTLHGKHPAPEHELNGWPGYADSRPVRVGNGAADQHQLDGYGWVLDAAWLLTSAGHRLYGETWRAMAGFADTVAARWREPDAGIWEVRTRPAHHVHSKLMAWLALDRALRIAEIAARRAAAASVGPRARRARDRDHDAGFDRHRGTFTRTYGSDDLDAALLVLPLLGDRAGRLRPRPWEPSTRSDATSTPAVHCSTAIRPVGTDCRAPRARSCPVSFWLVQALAKSGRTARRPSCSTHSCTLASPLGLYAEEIDPVSRPPSRQLPTSAHPRRPRPSRPRAPRRSTRALQVVAPLQHGVAGRSRSHLDLEPAGLRSVSRDGTQWCG